MKQEIFIKSEKRLKEFVLFLLKWQKKINLISKKDEANIWERHVLDCVELFFLIPYNTKVVVDMGSGGGFPAIVLGILNAIEKRFDEIVLVESCGKKATFLQEALRIFSIKGKVLNNRLETLKGVVGNIVTARALAPVDKLVKYAENVSNKDSVFLFMKGRGVEKELADCTTNREIQLIKNNTGFIVQMKGNKDE